MDNDIVITCTQHGVYKAIDDGKSNIVLFDHDEFLLVNTNRKVRRKSSTTYEFMIGETPIHSFHKDKVVDAIEFMVKYA